MKKLKVLLTVVLVAALVSLAYCLDTISPQDATKHIGETKTGCGAFASTHFAAKSKGQPTFINLDKPYQVFTVLICGSDRGKFEKAPEVLYSWKEICVTGMIQSYPGQAGDHREGARTNFNQMTPPFLRRFCEADFTDFINFGPRFSLTGKLQDRL